MTQELLLNLATALGLGLLIGAVRERQHGNATTLQAGVRTHALLALMARMEQEKATMLASAKR